MACKRRHTQKMSSYRKGQKRQKGTRREEGSDWLSDLIYHFLPGPLCSNQIHLLAISQTYQANTHIRAVNTCSSGQTPQTSSFTPSLSSGLCLNITLFNRDPYAYFYSGLFACFSLTKLQKIPAFPISFLYFVFP